MKTKEFIEKVEALGYEVKKSYNEIRIKNKSSIVLVYIKNNEMFSADTAHTAGFKDLSDDEKTALMSVLYDFIATDPKEREEEKRYYLKKIPVPLLKESDDLWYYEPINKLFKPGVDRDRTDNEKYKSIFTESEIAQMDITGFEKVEVTE